MKTELDAVFSKTPAYTDRSTRTCRRSPLSRFAGKAIVFEIHRINFPNGTTIVTRLSPAPSFSSVSTYIKSAPRLCRYNNAFSKTQYNTWTKNFATWRALDVFKWFIYKLQSRRTLTKCSRVSYIVESLTSARRACSRLDIPFSILQRILVSFYYPPGTFILKHPTIRITYSIINYELIFFATNLICELRVSTRERYVKHTKHMVWTPPLVPM